jgi:hypothetical protein
MQEAGSGAGHRAPKVALARGGTTRLTAPARLESGSSSDAIEQGSAPGDRL